MGTINYGSNKILINVGYHYDFDYSEEEIKEICEEYDYSKETAIDLCREQYDDCVRESRDLVQKKLKDLGRLDYYLVSLEYGYYEGFYISIKRDIIFLDNSNDRKEMHKELTKIVNFVKECIKECHLVQYEPWWSTSYEDEETSLKNLKVAVRKERNEINKLLTDIQVARLPKDKRKELLGW